MDYKFKTKVHSDINGIKITVDELLQNIRGLIDESVFFNTKIILYELIINGVMHGNKEDASKQISINFVINNSCIIIEITDEGSGITYKKKACGDYDFCECGRGLMLVEGLSDKFSIDGNKVTCIQYINAALPH